MSDELKPVINLGRRLREAADTEGLEMIRFMVQPALDDGETHSVSAVFVLGETLAIEEPVDNPEFEALIESQLKADEEQQTAEARKRLEEMNKRLSDPSKGLGLDDD